MPLNEVLRRRANSVAMTLNSHRFLVYSFISVLAVSAVVVNALRSYSNFYSVTISLSKSNRSVLALINFGFLIALLCGHVVQRLFFGTLRPNEVERLYDRLWFFITESLLAFTIFRDEFDIPFVLMFGFLLFVKSFHWLAGDRIEWMDQRPYPGPSLLFHIRISTLFLILWLTDFIMFLIAIENTLANGVGGMVLFASEYGILMASVLNAIFKYLLSAYELRRAGRRGGEDAPPWEHKSMWVFYIELATDFLKLTTYLVFFTIIIAFYGLPLNIVRDVYITARSFITRLRALHRYQTATRNMDQRYANATVEELTSMSDRTCIICREEMITHDATPSEGHPPVTPDGPNTTPKKLPCGHIFHFHCLRSWLERQQSCPTCRRTVLDTPTHDQNADARAPQRAADPQRANPVLPGARNQNQNQNQQGFNNPLGNPLGLLGRFFGPAALQPAVPAQAQVENPPNVNNVPPGNLQEVVIQYHIQYQPQLRQQHQQQNSQQYLRPPPPFPGFPGPGGAWQPWPIGPDHPAINGEARGRTLPGVTRSASAEPVVTPPVDGGLSRHASVASRDDKDQVAPRDAAALAALRRLNNVQPAASGSSVSETVPRAELRDATSTASSSAPHAPPPSPLAVPSLIPLYNYGSLVNPTLQTPQNGMMQPISGNPRSPMSPAIHPRIGNHFPRAAVDPRARSEQTTVPDQLSRLPSMLTEEQLATMDRLTREAIDERLRVLEGVSSAVYGCIDDLMRMRSVLPSLIPIGSTDSTPSVHPEPSGVTRENGHESDKDRNTKVLNSDAPVTRRGTNGKAPESTETCRDSEAEALGEQ